MAKANHSKYWAVYELLEQAGWRRDGQTDSEMVRVPTRDAPVYGGIGGELRTFGGRPRFHLEGTDRFATVGKRTVCFYRKPEKGQPTDFVNIPTKDESAIRVAAQN